MIRHEDGKMQLVCDREACDAATPLYEKNQFMPMIDAAKEAKWIIFKRNNKGPFLHFCDWMHSGQPDHEFLETWNASG